MKLLHIAAGTLIAVGFAFTANAAEHKFKATLNGAAEVPPVAGAGKGMAEFTIDDATKEIMWKITYEGLSGDALAAHIHGPADATANGGVVISLGVQGQPLKSPLEGKATLTDAQIADIAAGKTYVNFHTVANKGGEVRGQIMK